MGHPCKETWSSILSWFCQCHAVRSNSTHNLFSIFTQKNLKDRAKKLLPPGTSEPVHQQRDGSQNAHWLTSHDSKSNKSPLATPGLPQSVPTETSHPPPVDPKTAKEPLISQSPEPRPHVHRTPHLPAILGGCDLVAEEADYPGIAHPVRGLGPLHLPTRKSGEKTGFQPLRLLVNDSSPRDRKLRRIQTVHPTPNLQGPAAWAKQSRVPDVDCLRSAVQQLSAVRVYIRY